jgi:hypothetical protein
MPFSCDIRIDPTDRSSFRRVFAGGDDDDVSTVILKQGRRLAAWPQHQAEVVPRLVLGAAGERFCKHPNRFSPTCSGARLLMVVF